jgi:haloalkane dehalogenase
MEVIAPARDTMPRKRIKVLDTEMSYVEVGEGDSIVFLHGNPTSSYLWRNILPFLSDLGRCLAPDLVGMGGSGPAPDKQYRFLDHARYLDGWFESVGLSDKVVLVIHDWGSALGFYWAMRHPDRVKAIVYMEAIVQPRLWADFPAGRDALFRAMRSATGEELILDQNFFVETVLPKSVIRSLSALEMEAYRAPFITRESRLPTLVFPRELPIDGEPADVANIVRSYGQFMKTALFPKLLISADPGAILVGRALAFCRTWAQQTEVRVRGIHYIQEDSPVEIFSAIQDFFVRL